MDDQRKSAYRNLLYLAMLDIRPVERLGTGGWWSIAIHGRREVRRVEWAGAIADWLHNLALFSAHDFRGFDEQRFWREFEAIRSGYPEFGPDRYRARFEHLAGAPPALDAEPAAAAAERGTSARSGSVDAGAARAMTSVAPEPILRAALRVVHVAAYTTRNWTYADGWPRQQVYDLWEALHVVPDLVTRWRPDAERELLGYLDEYDHKWPAPRLRELYERRPPGNQG